MKVLKGDLIKFTEEGNFDVIVHGCNCFCNMGAGVAKAIKRSFPEAYKTDCMTKKGYKKKLGTISGCTVDRNGRRFIVLNGYTQYNYGKGKHLNYTALRKIFKEIADMYPTSRIGYPKIGAGLAGGDWKIIKKIINEELEGMDHTLVVFGG